MERKYTVVWIDKYKRSDGTVVRAHSRWAPGARREMTVLAVVALAVVGMGNGARGGTADGTAPRPQSTVQYPIRFEGASAEEGQAAQPRPAVSYPVRWQTPKSTPTVPRPTVLYPIDFSTMGSGR
ncbi:hypothetical protein AB0B60_43970 [Streptomyces lincolnensis]|uniref:hypothetical protein n=1 Tax=Streptomyces lincolnensis TaxID=1915 RepID=UPI00082AF703|nr:hypothetical protein [Streptomyces lincolnensis]